MAGGETTQDLEASKEVRRMGQSLGGSLGEGVLPKLKEFFQEEVDVSAQCS